MRDSTANVVYPADRRDCPICEGTRFIDLGYLAYSGACPACVGVGRFELTAIEEQTIATSCAAVGVKVRWLQ